MGCHCGLSRRGQGQPNSEEIAEVLSGMAGLSSSENEVITFRALLRSTGAGVDLARSYNWDNDPLDFHGALKLDAKYSKPRDGDFISHCRLLEYGFCELRGG